MDHTVQMYDVPKPITCHTCGKLKNGHNFSAAQRSSVTPTCKNCVIKSNPEEMERVRKQHHDAHLLRKSKDPLAQKRRYEEIRAEFHSKMESGKLEIDPDLILRLEARLKTEDKVCKTCLEKKPLTQYHIRIRHGKHINIRPNCKSCHNRETSEGAKARPVKRVITSYRRNSLKRGLECDLTEDFVRTCFSLPCEYCGENSILMTVDRKDSSIGHVISNCVPCCIRCNLVKSDMPYEAWTIVSVGMRQAREKRLFGGWIGRNNFRTGSNISR
jgi:hypothetical protein